MNFIKALDASGTENGLVVTEVASFRVFYPAEREHRLFYQNNPGSMYCSKIAEGCSRRVEAFRPGF